MSQRYRALGPPVAEDLDFDQLRRDIDEAAARRVRALRRNQALAHTIVIAAALLVILLTAALLFEGHRGAMQASPATVIDGGCTQATKPAGITTYCRNPINGEARPCRTA